MKQYEIIMLIPTFSQKVIKLKGELHTAHNGTFLFTDEKGLCHYYPIQYTIINEIE